MRQLNSLFAFSTALLLTACGTLIDGQTQKVTLATPGAYEAECTLNNGVVYKLRTGESVDIMRSQHDIKVDCYAPGNRHIAQIVESKFNGNAAGDIILLPGAAYDHFSGGLYEYPEVITVDFVGTPTLGYELPQFMNKDVPNPYRQAIEGYAPNNPALPEDSTYLKRGLPKRNAGTNSNPFSDAPSAPQGSGVTAMPQSSGAAPATTAQPAVPTGNNAESLTRSANPAVFNSQ